MSFDNITEIKTLNNINFKMEKIYICNYKFSSKPNNKDVSLFDRINKWNDKSHIKYTNSEGIQIWNPSDKWIMNLTQSHNLNHSNINQQICDVPPNFSWTKSKRQVRTCTIQSWYNSLDWRLHNYREPKLHPFHFLPCTKVSLRAMWF
jgi:hypothetical protein